MSYVRDLEKRFNLERYLKKFKPKNYGIERAIECPYCEKEEKFWINVVKKVGFCYYCEETIAGPLDLIQALDDVPLAEAILILESGVKDRQGDFASNVASLFRSEDGLVETADKGPLREIELPDSFVPYTKAKRVPRYFKERGIGPKRAERYNIGFCDRGYYWNRMIVPIVMREKLVSFHARFMKKNPPKDVKKVLYPKGTKSNQMLFNYDVAKKQRLVVLMEDPFSAMVAGKFGTATFGTKLSDVQFGMLLRAEASEYVICWDLDAYAKAQALGKKLGDFGLSIRVVRLPDERDPDELPTETLWRLIRGSQTAGIDSLVRSLLGVESIASSGVVARKAMRQRRLSS